MPTTHPHPQRPNILFVYMDDMGYGDMGCFGARAVRTPHMDRIGSEGMRLTACYATNAMCSPSRASLLTGRYAGRCLIPRVLFPRDHIGLDPDQHQTFGAALQEQGYTTGCFGKWHVGCTPRSHPCRNGFDRFVGLPYSNDMDPLPLFEDERCVEEDPDQAWLTKRYCDAAMDFIDSAGEQPWCAYIAHTMPHIPLHVEPGFRGQSLGGTYGDTIECIDHHLGRLLVHLEAQGQLERTLIVVTSDNGPWFEGGTAGLRGRKFDLYEGGVRMPCVARLPGLIPAGSDCELPVSQMDFFPTFLRLAGASDAHRLPLDGIDITDLLAGRRDQSQRTLYFYSGYGLAACRRGPWKAHRWDFKGGTKEMPQLFDLSWDREEAWNVGNRFPDVLEELVHDMERFDHELKAHLPPDFEQQVARPATDTAHRFDDPVD